ncbi:universal stress protein [Flavobacterium sp.]|uniref:universal stress protein n=1 Tax=Flavobacterium sp. TaxID=239 RepID=UPI00404788E7
MKNILVPLGSRKTAVSTLQYAIDFATVSGSKIFVVQAYGVPRIGASLKNVNDVLAKKGKMELTEIMEKVDTKNVDITKITIKGNILDSISVLEKELSIDLIIASAKPVAKDSTLYLGPITGSFVKKTDIPMIIVPKGFKFEPIERVMLGVRSGLLNHDNILDPLAYISKLFNSKISLIHIITPKNDPEDNVLHDDFKSIGNEIIYSENATVFHGVLEYLNQVNPNILCVIRNKRGFLNRLLESDSIKKEDFDSRIPLLVLKGNL